MCYGLLLLALLLPLLQKQNIDKPAAQKQVTQKQVQPSEDAQKVSNPSRSDSAPVNLYTYISPRENNPETAKIIFDGLLVLFTLGLVWVGLKQAKILSEHEGWMEKHDAKLEKLAQAANENAKALINSERAWVTVYAKWNDGHHLYDVSGRTAADVKVIYVNRGKSPAWIVEQCIKIEVSNGFYGPDYSDVDDSEIDRRFIPLSPRGEPISSGTDNPIRLTTKEAVGNRYILIYGYVKYRDIFTENGQPRETGFGFYTSIANLKDPLTRIAQTEYNQYT
jgi:hypothetical protein